MAAAPTRREMQLLPTPNSGTVFPHPPHLAPQATGSTGQLDSASLLVLSAGPGRQSLMGISVLFRCLSPQPSSAPPPCGGADCGWPLVLSSGHAGAAPLLSPGECGRHQRPCGWCLASFGVNPLLGSAHLDSPRHSNITQTVFAHM